jgi:hypothetical protein
MEEELDHHQTSSAAAPKAVLRVFSLMMPPKETRIESEKAHPGCARKLLGLPELSQKQQECVVFHCEPLCVWILH